MPPSNSPKVLLLAGPPASAALWRDVQARLSSHLPVEAVELFDPLPADPTVAGLAASVADRARALGGDVVIVAHGVVIRVILTSILPGSGPADFERFAIDNAAINDLRHDGTTWRAEALNQHAGTEVERYSW